MYENEKRLIFVGHIYVAIISFPRIIYTRLIERRPSLNIYIYGQLNIYSFTSP